MICHLPFGMSNHHDQSRCVSSGWICASHVPPPIPSTMNLCCSLCPIIGCLRWLRRNLKTCMGNQSFSIGTSDFRLRIHPHFANMSRTISAACSSRSSAQPPITSTDLSTSPSAWLSILVAQGCSSSRRTLSQLSSGITFLSQKLTIAISVTKATTLTVHPV